MDTLMLEVLKSAKVTPYIKSAIRYHHSLFFRLWWSGDCSRFVAAELYGNGVLVGSPTYLVRRRQCVGMVDLLPFTLLQPHCGRASHIKLVAHCGAYPIYGCHADVSRLRGTSPHYLGLLVRVADLPGRCGPRSASTSQLVVLPYKLCTSEPPRLL